MAILSSDIKLRESERMTDATDGGGRRTLNVIQDGVAGNIFPKVSRLDSVYGRVNLRKVYAHIDTNSVDTYAGAHFIVTDAPDNDRIHVTAFSTASEFDQRTAARDRVESYVIAGPESRMVLYGRQLVGAQALLVYQREQEPLPEIGEVYVVSNETGGITGDQQFVAVQDMDHELRTFVDDQGEFVRRVITLTIGAPLRFEFVGFAVPSRMSGSPAGGKVRSTTAADASRYFGIQPLVDAAATNDLTLMVDSVYTPIVPTTQRETAVSLAAIAGATQSLATGLQTVYFSANISTSSTTTFICRNQITPGSLRIYLALLGTAYTAVVSDDSNGLILGDTVSTGVRITEGTVNYTTGTVSIVYAGELSTTPGTWAVRFSYVPAVEVSQPSHTRAIEITLGTRGTIYTPVLSPLPSAGSLIIDYRALGKWYRLRDDGMGELSGGDAAYGTGTVNYVTGGVIVTLGALPDVGSSILLSWGSPTHYEIKTDDAGTSAQLRLTLPDVPVKRGSAVFTYYVNGVATTANAGIQGSVSGANSVTGSVQHFTGDVLLDFGGKLPDTGSVVSVAYQQEVPTTPGEVPLLAGSFPALDQTTLDGFPFTPGTVSISVVTMVDLDSYSRSYDLYGQVKLVDDGVGNLIARFGSLVGAAINTGVGDCLVSVDTVVGTINYTTGVVQLTQVSIPADSQLYVYGDFSGSANWGKHPVSGRIVSGSTAAYTVKVSSVATSDSARTHSVSLDDTALQIDLLRSVSRSVVAGSIMFRATGKIYIERNGTVYTDFDAATGVALAVGTIDYSTAVIDLKQWNNNSALSLTVDSCLTKFGDFVTSGSFFRTAGSPNRPASVYVQVVSDEGTLITGLCDQNGVITGTYMRGNVEQIMGVVSVEFGQMVTAAGNELQPWYNVANVVGSQVWKPTPVQPGTLRYSTVVLSNLPLNADILGLDPVRLPSDGRVPIYRPADVVVIHNTQSYNAGTPTASQVINLGRTNLAVCWLEDANKLKLPVTKYSVDYTNGIVTMAADLSLTGYVTPITVRHRIEEMSLLSDVQINGQLGLTAPLLREYPLGSYVSSALLFGDLFARVTGVFDQGTWTNVWSNALIGTQATAQYNDVDYPIAVMNSSAVSDRWRISFTSATAFQVISENLGVIATGTTSADLAPINPLTGLAYFTLQSEGWGLGWATGNQLRFNTVGSAPPVWLARTVLPGATLAGDSFDAQLRGDVD